MADKKETALRSALDQAESQKDPDAAERTKKHLAAAGHKVAAKKRAAAAKDDDEAQKRAPAGRSTTSPRKQTTSRVTADGLPESGDGDS